MNITQQHDEFNCLTSYLARTATLTGRHGRPTVVLDKIFAVWIANETTETMTVSGCELLLDSRAMVGQQVK